MKWVFVILFVASILDIIRGRYASYSNWKELRDYPKRLNSAFAPVARIVGGTDATKNEFPYQVSIRLLDMFGTIHICGGAILDPQYILTAAQCVSTQSPNDLWILAGALTISSPSGDEQERGVAAVAVHPLYDGIGKADDIALLKLSRPLVFGDAISSIQVAWSEPPTGTQCTMTGWGTICEGATSPSNTLQKVLVSTVSDADCRSAYCNNQITSSMLCAGDVAGGKDSCQGDEGGPLQCAGLLHGLASWGYGCGRPPYPGVYTQVMYYDEWIQENIAAMESNN